MGDDYSPLRTPVAGTPVGTPVRVRMYSKGAITKSEYFTSLKIATLPVDEMDYFIVPDFKGIEYVEKLSATMKYGGESLNKILNDPIDPVIILKAIVDVAKGLTILKKAKIAHLDLWTGNIVIGSIDGVEKGRIIDFGESIDYSLEFPHESAIKKLLPQYYWSPEYFIYKTKPGWTSYVGPASTSWLSSINEGTKYRERIKSAINDIGFKTDSEYKLTTDNISKVDVYALGFVLLRCIDFINDGDYNGIEIDPLFEVIKDMTKFNPADRIDVDAAYGRLYDIIINKSEPMVEGGGKKRSARTRPVIGGAMRNYMSERLLAQLSR